MATTALATVPLPPPMRYAPDIAQLLGIFLTGRASRTVEAYRADLADFAGFVAAEALDEAARFLLAHNHGEANALALTYKAHLTSKGLSPATINRRLAALRSLCRLAQTIGLISWTLSVENMRGEALRDSSGPGLSGCKALLRAAAAQKGPRALRDVALIRLMHDCALRRGECISLDLDHVELARDRIWVHGKGRAQREAITLPPATKAALVAWIKVRGAQEGPLFVSFSNCAKSCRLTGEGVRVIIRGLGRSAGIAARPHGLRHAGITAALTATNGDVRRCAKYSRHRDVATLTIYDDSRLDHAGDVARLVAALLAE